MVFCPEITSSTKPLSSPSIMERLRNSGRTRFVIYRVNKMDMGMVTAKTSTSRGEMAIIITREPSTVMTLAAICSRSLEREAFTVSIS